MSRATNPKAIAELLYILLSQLEKGSKSVKSFYRSERQNLIKAKKDLRPWPKCTICVETGVGLEQYLTVSGEEMRKVLDDFSNCTEGLEISAGSRVKIKQKDDGKGVNLAFEELHEVLVRRDQDNRVFLQVNLANGTKLLLTNNWIGFKPYLEEEVLEKVPAVVTTPDIVSVFEALEESKRLGLADEAKTLRKIYMAIIMGGEQVGFDMMEERLWIQRLALSTSMSA
tara:strand:- start:1123 stop:1803 length:681 start_codon:yes stop_codon:yes gene_type:complete